MDSKSIIRHIKDSKKRTPVKAYIALRDDCEHIRNRIAANHKDGRASSFELLFENCRVFECGRALIAFGDLADVQAGIARAEAWTDETKDCGCAKSLFSHIEIEALARNSALPLLDIKSINARIEPGAIIREKVTIGEHAVIMMGAIINIGAKVGERTMIDMGAVLGGRAIVGADCHVGAGAVIAGVIEPESAVPTTIEDEVFIGANAVVIEGCRVGHNSVIGAGAVVTCDVPPNSVVVGVPGRIIKSNSAELSDRMNIIEELREI